MENNKKTDLEITHVSQFIDEIRKLIDSHSGKKVHFLYRGESKRYPDYCKPNIFRKNVLSTK